MPRGEPPVPVWLTGGALGAPRKTELKTPAPLFKRESERALVVEMARCLRAHGPIDVDRLAQISSSLSFPRALPRRRVPSLIGGVSLFVDRSEWMAPFELDVSHVRSRFRLHAGRVQEHEISNLAALEELTQHGQRPAAGSAVVIISDLGRSASQADRARHVEAWMAFVDHVQNWGGRAIVLAPGKRSSYGSFARMKGTLLLGWDPSTRVGEVARFRRDGLR